MVSHGARFGLMSESQVGSRRALSLGKSESWARFILLGSARCCFKKYYLKLLPLSADQLNSIVSSQYSRR